MAEGDIPYRFKNDQWEVWDEYEERWVRASSQAAALLKDYTKVKDIGQGRLVFYAEGGDTMIEEVLLYRIEQMNEADRVKNAPWWGPEATAAFGPYYPQHPKMAQALNYSQDLKLPGTPGVSAPVTPKATPPLIFKSKTEAEAEVAANGGQVVRRSDGNWGVVDAPVPEAPEAPEAPTFEEEFTSLLLSGQEEKARRLWDTREAITSGGGRMTRFQAAQLLLGDDLFKAEEIPALLEALMGGPQPGASKSFEEALGTATPEAAASSFPAMPFGALPGAQAAIDRNRQQVGAGAFNTPSQQAQARAAQGPFGMDSAEQAATGFAGANTPSDSFTSRIQADLKGVTDMQHSQMQAATQPGRGRLPDSVEEWDPSYAYADPEAQAAIKAAFDQLKAAETQPFTAATTSDAAVSAAQGGQRIIGNTAVNLVPGLGRPSGSGLFPAAMTPPDTTLRGIFAKGLPDVEAARQRLNAAGGGGDTFPPPPPPPKSLTFQDAMAQITQRRQQRQLLRKPQGRTLFA